MTRNRQLVGIAFAAVAAMLLAATLATALLLPPNLSSAETVWGRYAAQLVLLAVFVLPFRGKALVRTERPRLQIVRGLTMLVMPVAFTIATHHMNTMDAWADEWFAPIIGVAVASVAFGERVSAAQLVVVFAATCGAIVAHGLHAGASILALGAAAVSAVAFGMFFVFTRALRAEAATTGLFWTATCVFVPSCIVVAYRWQPLAPRTIVGLAAMGTLWFFVLLTIDEALRRAPLALIAPFLLTEIIWTRLLFRMPWSTGAVLGAAVVIAAAVWSIRAAMSTSDSRLPALELS
jgi:drug/metabolite transporter (DMT)-like permease